VRAEILRLTISLHLSHGVDHGVDSGIAKGESANIEPGARQKRQRITHGKIQGQAIFKL